MAVRHLNTAKLYFGGDIAKSVAEDNARRYKSHATWAPFRLVGCQGMKSYPGYIFVIRSYYKRPYEPTRIQWKVGEFFFFAWLK